MENGRFKVSIVMTYLDRKTQIMRTLEAFEKMYAGKYHFEVVIVDDNSIEEEKLHEVIKQFSFPIRLIVVSATEKGNRINPCIAYNIGFANANGEIIIIQNAECYHVGNLLEHAIENLGEEDYFAYSCFTANSIEIGNELMDLDFPKIKMLLQDSAFLEKNYALENINWYNHDTEEGRQTFYHFCSAIHKKKLDIIGGFDPRFADGYCFDDDAFVLAIRYQLKLNMKNISTESCFVISQYHERNASLNCVDKDLNDPVRIKWERNKKLYEDMKKKYEKD